MTKEERELIDEKFKGLTSLMNAHFTNVDDRLDRIEAQTTKTNGRVNELEKKELTHFMNCPQTEKIEKINEELAEYKMFKKYPKIGLALIAGAVLLFLVTTFTSIEKMKKYSTPQNLELIKDASKAINDSLNVFPDI